MNLGLLKRRSQIFIWAERKIEPEIGQNSQGAFQFAFSNAIHGLLLEVRHAMDNLVQVLYHILVKSDITCDMEVMYVGQFNT